MPTLSHPDLPGVVIDVDENKARNRRKAGWVDADGTTDGPLDGDVDPTPETDSEEE